MPFLSLMTKKTSSPPWRSISRPRLPVLTAYNGREALSVAAREDVHLILMDIMMPVMDDPTAMAQLQQTNQRPDRLLTAKSETPTGAGP